MNQNRIILILVAAMLVAGLIYNLGLLGGRTDAPMPPASNERPAPGSPSN